jgi:hypothetical protein
MGCAQSALLLSPSLLLESYLLNGRRYRARIFTTKWNALSPTLAPVSRLCNLVWITASGQLDILLIRSARHRQSSETQIKMCQAQTKMMLIILLQELQSSVRAGPKIRAGGRPLTEKWAVRLVCNCWDFGVVRKFLQGGKASHQLLHCN